MGKHLERAKELRNDPNRHYNCAQAVLAAFSQDAGMSEEDACRVSANFGSGMKMGATCGAVTGALMVLGLYGIEDSSSVNRLFRSVRYRHQGYLNCADLLRMNREAGGQQKSHCDGMVYECVEFLEEILADQPGTGK